MKLEALAIIMNDEEFQNFITTHYEIGEELSSLVPQFDGNVMKFNTSISVKRKSLSFMDKLSYYRRDLMIWKKKES